MKRTAMIVAVILLACAFSVPAKSYSLSVQKGGAEIVRSETGEQINISDTGTVNMKDLLSLSEGQAATLFIEKKTLLLMKGPMNLSLSESSTALTISLEDGQILLNRKEPHEFTTVSIIAKGYTFLPMGTTAAVKTSAQSQPTTAVISGKVRMQLPSGEAMVIEEGNFGSVGTDGKPSTSVLSPRAVESLKDWLATASAENNTILAQAPAIPSENSDPAVSPATTSPPAATPDAVAPKEEPPAATTSSEPPVDKPAPLSQQPAAGAPVSTAPAAEAAVAENKAAGESPEKNAGTAKKEEKPGAQKVEKTPAPPTAPKWEISAGTATVDNVQWTRLALGVDVPIWKFGIFFDVEFFIDNDGQFSDKGWNFKNDWLDALSRKIRYIRFGQEGEPLFIKVGGLSTVTMGYGFLVDRFTNMLHYPDQKQLGLQFDINNISPVGVTLQTLVADFKDFDNDGGVVAARLALRPLKMTEIPIVKGICIGGSYATDLNQYAPARKWRLKEPVSVKQLNLLTQLGLDSASAIDTITRSWNGTDPNEDYAAYLDEKHATRADDPFGLIGADVGIPLITTDLVGLDVYGQAGLRDDGKHGWGIGAPGVSLKIWRLWANVEYRHVQGRFQPGYFGTYYLDERLIRDPVISTKEQRLMSDTLNGIFGRLGFNIAEILLIDGSYQYMVGRQEENKDQRFEATAGLGDLLLDKIPKLNKAEFYYYKSRIGNENDDFFEKTPFMYVGYRAGFEIAAGASLIFDSRYGYKKNENGKLVSNNNISVQTAISF
jgi:hypothetical protein